MILVTVAGFPRNFADVIRKKAVAIKGENGHLICPDNRDSEDYSSGYIKKILSEMANNIEGFPRNKKISSVVFYIDFRTEGTRLLKSNLFPHSLAMPIDKPDLKAPTPQIAREKANNLVDGCLKDMADEARRRLGIIQHEVVNNANKSPILLPVKSFKSRHLQKELLLLSERLATDIDTRAALDIARKTLNHYHPQKQKKSGSKNYFLDDRNLFFEAPCTAGPNHGNKSAGKEDDHRPLCTLNGVSRLGGGFLRGFHYDCSVGKGNVKMDFINCHDKEVSANQEWLNIYPNDHIR